MKRAILALAALAIAAALSGLAAKKTALITIPARIELKAPPARVWAAITSVEGFGTLTGFKPTGPEKTLARLGDSVAAEVWEDKGRLVVTEVAPGKELRVAWEPAQGHYLCQKKIVLTPSGSGTALEYVDRYTDDQPNADETARQVATETERNLEAFRRLVEK